MGEFGFKFFIGDAQEFLIKRANELINLVAQQKFDSLVFLDRSARPASWIFEAFWNAKFPRKKVPLFVFICTGKKKNLTVDSSTLAQIKHEFSSKAKNLKGKKILIVDDIEKDGTQRKFVEQVLEELYKPSSIGFFEWNKLGGIRLSHGLSYEDNGSFIAKEDKLKQEAVEQVKKEIKQLAC